MQVSVSGHQLAVTAALREHVLKKFARLTSHSDSIIHAQVTLSVIKQRQRAESHLQLRNTVISGSCEHEDMYAAIDLLVDKVDRQLIKHKEKQAGRKQRNFP